MAYCNQTLAGIQLDCTNSLGGIKTVYIANYNDILEIQLSEEEEGSQLGKITTIEMVDGGTFKPYQFRKQTGSMTSTLNIDEQAGINYVSTELSLVFTKMETAKRLEMTALAKAQLAVIVEDSNNKYWYLGYDDYVSASAGSANTGQSKGDSNNYGLTLRDESETFPYEVAASVIETLGLA